MKFVNRFTLFLIVLIFNKGILSYSQAPCDPYPSTIEKGCNCEDNIDNDGDGLKDILDPDCASYYGLTFIGEGSSACSIMPPDTAGAFKFVGPPSVTQQNTVDTQSKMAIADMDGDGIPEVIATSKWGKAVRIIATNGPDAGDIIDEFGKIDILVNKLRQGAVYQF